MGPLTGIKIIEFASIGPIPMCGMLLADMGAQVIRIDRIGDADLGIKRDPAFEYTSRGKRSVALDLKKSEAVAAALKLIASADALIEGFRPGVMERLGLGPKQCLDANPSLVYGRLTGWGQEGPLSKAAGHDMNFIALTGALDAIGLPDGPPVAPLNLLGDFAGGSLFLAFGIACALAAPNRAGRGQVIDAAITDGVLALMASILGQAASGTWQKGRGEHVIGGAAPWNTVYETADGLFVTVCAIEARFYQVLLERLGLNGSELPDRMDRTRWPELRTRLAEVFRTKTRDAWCDLLEGSDACFAPVLSANEAHLHAQARTRGMFTLVEGKLHPATAPRFSRTRATIQGAPVMRPGQHSVQVLTDAGFSQAEIQTLAAQGAVHIAT